MTFLSPLALYQQDKLYEHQNMNTGRTRFKKGCIPWNKNKKQPGTLGEKAYNWINGKIGYDTLHHWLYRNYGKAIKCENINCKEKDSKRFEWSLIRGKKYERKKENFIQLCSKCHKKYDEHYKKLWKERRRKEIIAIRQIRQMWKMGWKQKEIAKKFNYTQSGISKIVTFKAWQE